MKIPRFFGGKAIEVSVTRDMWVDLEIRRCPGWDWVAFDYRIKQVSPMVIIPWDAIKPEYKWAAKDADGLVYLYQDKPYAGTNADKWFCQLSYTFTNALIIQDPDNIDWKDSLVERSST